MDQKSAIMILFDIFADALQEYCDKNHLDFGKIKASPKCGNGAALFIQRLGNHSTGLERDKPAEILLFAKKDETEKILVEKRPGADKYLAKER